MKAFWLTIHVSLLLAVALILFDSSPVAAVPRDCSNTWYANWSLEFAPGFWESGMHTYEISVEYPDTGFFLYNNEFQSSEDVPLLKKQNIRLGIFGLMSEEGSLVSINPAQDTVMQLTMYGSRDVEGFTTQKQRKAYVEETVVQFSWDDGEMITISPGPVTNGCAAGLDNPGRFKRSYGPVYAE